MLENQPKILRVGIGGMGAIGAALARHLDHGVHGLSLVAISVRQLDKVRPNLEKLRVMP